MRIQTLIATTTLALTAASNHAADWQNWRGANMDGSSGATGVPTTFSQKENVRSSIALTDGAALIRTDGKLFCLGK